ncbi:FitA-like ribbon-helix-helix domain-containing protein [Nocardia yunnanensis]|uniref:FitA-like ribbon-helix-helix domain-containing protein n=1 Tax=Nocardia yunnanensis TaxID=2382165 RepID=UPI001CA42CA0
MALQIRDVPDEVRDTLAEQAARRGQSLQAFLLGLVEREARLVHNEQMFAETADLRIEIPDDLSPETIIREGRERGFDLDREDDHE